MVELPRFVIAKSLASGGVAFYFNVPTHYRRLGCDISNEPLGTAYDVACERAAVLNQTFDEWNHHRRGGAATSGKLYRYGTVDWLFREYKSSTAYLEKVSLRSRPDYERTMLMVANLTTKKGDRIGGRDVRAISPLAADKLYELIIAGKNGERLRQGEKAVKLCSKAWRVVHRLHPREFDTKVPDPWSGVALKRRVKNVKAAVTREQVYEFAWGCIDRGRPEPAAAAVICFEWLQRPENVIGGKIRWGDYRSEQHPNLIRIEHHKTGKMVLHPLEESTPDGIVKFYEEAEAVLSHLPRRGVPMILREVAPRNADEQKICKPYSFSGFEKIIQNMRKATGLPPYLTLDACRHGGMTELEEAELTDGQGRALSAHTSKAYDGYAKRTEKRALAATRKRYAHIIAKNRPISILAEVPVPTEQLGGGMGYIYFVESAGFVKIGFTFHIPTRFHELQIAAPEKLRLLRYDIGTREIESSYHSRFAALRSSGEWFRIEGELSEFLSQRDKSKTEFLNRRADVVRTVK